jgi:hypothetical protein
MRIREFIDVVPTRELQMELPLVIDLDSGLRLTLDQRDGASLRLVIDYPVDRGKLKLERNTRTYEQLSDGGRRELPALRVPENDEIQASDVAAALTFLTDVPVNTSRPHPSSEIVPEDDEDRAVLDAFGTSRVFAQLGSQPSIRTFNPIVDADSVQAVLPKTAGLRLYADALALNTDVARYRELWRILESAFGLQDDALVHALAAYPPAQELEFDRDELRELLVLRGRASHAATKGGLTEILRIGAEARRRSGRLKCLTERVILTKQSWGTRGAGVEELTPAVSWVGRDGQIVIRRSAS